MLLRRRATTIARALLLPLFSAGLVHASIAACAVLKARPQKSDTLRIQEALNRCGPGKSVILKADGGSQSFRSAPLILPRGVTLFVDQSVTLLASKNPRDYDLTPNSCDAAAVGKAPNCKPFLFSYQAAYSGVAGGGTIDGQGGGWKGNPTAPDLVSSYESQGFRIEGVTLRNTAGIHAAIFKTIGLRVSRVRIEGTASTGMLLSNAVDAEVNDSWIRVEGTALLLTGSILGPTANVRVNRTSLGGGGVSIGQDVHEVSMDGAVIKGSMKATGDGAPAAGPIFDVDFSSVDRPGKKRSLIVAAGESIQKAVDALPLNGGDITVRPGTYREVVTIRKPHVRLHGSDPSKTTIVFANGAVNNGGTFNSATVFVEADDVQIDHLSIVNDLGSGKGQAVALHVTGDRAVFRDLRISAAQDTLFAASRYCYGDYGPCVATRQYFADCFIEGNTDFIFGESGFRSLRAARDLDRQRDVHGAKQAHRGAGQRLRVCSLRADRRCA